jgi:hypothetical protein
MICVGRMGSSKPGVEETFVRRFLFEESPFFEKK